MSCLTLGVWSQAILSNRGWMSGLKESGPKLTDPKLPHKHKDLLSVLGMLVAAWSELAGLSGLRERIQPEPGMFSLRLFAKSVCFSVCAGVSGLELSNLSLDLWSEAFWSELECPFEAVTVRSELECLV